MVYIISCNINRMNKKELEEMRQQFIQQIHEGVVMLPLGFTLAQVVDTKVGIEQVELGGITYVPVPNKKQKLFIEKLKED